MGALLVQPRLQLTGRWKAGDGIAGMHHERAGMLGEHGFS